MNWKVLIGWLLPSSNSSKSDAFRSCTGLPLAVRGDHVDRDELDAGTERRLGAAFAFGFGEPGCSAATGKNECDNPHVHDNNVIAPCAPCRICNVLRSSRSLFPPTTLANALDRFGFVQADPIRSPARAQDLTLRPRVTNYHAGDLETHYATLPIEEDFFINYGFVTQAPAVPDASALVGVADRRQQAREGDPRVRARARHGAPARSRRALRARPRDELLGRLVERDHAHARADALQGHVARGAPRSRHSHLRGAAARPRSHRRGREARAISIGSSMPSSASTRPCPPRASRSSSAACAMRRRTGTPRSRAPFSARSSVWRMRSSTDTRGIGPRTNRCPITRSTACGFSRRSIRWCGIDGASKCCGTGPIDSKRTRRPPKRKHGYYALPLIWRNRVIGWANVGSRNETIDAQFGYVSGRAPRDRGFKSALDAEVEAMRTFLD